MSTDQTSSIADVIRNAVTQPVHFHACDEAVDGMYRPAMDLKDSPSEYVAYIDLPGVDEDDLEFSWDEQSLCIGGCRDFNHDTEDAEEFILLERKFGKFRCYIPLNDTLDVSLATAKYRRGVLKVSVPKRRTKAKYAR